MSVFALFRKLFSGKKSETRDKPQTIGEAIQSLRETREILKKRQGVLEKKIETEMILIRKDTNKRMAMNALKRKNRYDKYLQQNGTQTLAVDKLLQALTTIGSIAS